MKIDFPYTKELLILNNIFNQNGEDNLRIVGGAVRNFILKKDIVDFDLSCKFNPDEVTDILKKNNIKNVPTGFIFGTVTAIVNGKTFEITSARKDVETDGRHAKVQYTGDFEIDAGRRDFTFNALYLDFNGNVYDYFDGLIDLKKGIVRFIGDSEKRIQEDYLRILRFFRFYCYYGSVLDNDSFMSCVKYKDELRNLSGERIRNEMFKIFNAEYPIKTLKIMEQADILQKITTLNNFDFQYLEVLYSLKKFILEETTIDLILSLFVKDDKELQVLRERWKLSNKEYLNSLNLLKYKGQGLFNSDAIKRFLFLTDNKSFVINLFIFNAILNFSFITENLSEFINKNILIIKEMKFNSFPIDGNDLNKSGFEQKSEYKKILDYGKELFIESDFSLNKKEILKKLKEKFLLVK